MMLFNIFLILKHTVCFNNKKCFNNIYFEIKTKSCNITEIVLAHLSQLYICRVIALKQYNDLKSKTNSSFLNHNMFSSVH